MRKTYWTVASALLTTTLAVALYAWPGSKAESSTDLRPTATVRTGSIDETVLATGVIRPVTGAEINVGSRISGTVVSLPVAVGERVEVGQLLAELDASSLEAQADEARADVALSLPRIELAESILNRRLQLAKNGLASTEDLDTAENDLAVARAQLKADEARLRSANIALGYTRVTAPISGVVAEVSTREGETVAAAFAAPNFVTIIDLDRLEVLAYVDETDIGRVFVGQRASFNVDTYADVEINAVVTAIQPRAELLGTVVNYLVRLEFEPSADIVLRPEMTAHVRIVIAERDDVLTAPRSAVRRTAGRQYVMVQRANQWTEQDVRTGWRSDETIEIISGVRDGDVLELNARN